MKIAYGELIGGISGDMFVAALLDLGLPLAKLKSELKKIPTLRYRLTVYKKTVHSIRATRFQVTCDNKKAGRSWKQIRTLIAKSRLPSLVKETGIDIFYGLAVVEGKIHGVPSDRVHFHEVGATDSIVDIMAAAIGICELGIEDFHFSRIPLGRGVTRSMHGPLPVPGPATLELLQGLPVIGIDVESETVTPTGAAIVRTLGKSFGEQPPMTMERIGYGAGQKDFAERPNLFRVSLGTQDLFPQSENMLVIETNIDDMNPEFYDYVFDRLLEAGARDVFLSPIQMKKNRPGILLSVIAEPADRDTLSRTILRETSTLGVRYYSVGRIILKRASKRLKTRYGSIRVKVVEEPGGTTRLAPEYDDLKRIASAKKIPLKLLYDQVVRNINPDRKISRASNR
ncbi:MAG TPA: nickel pincer cofactor biosynthesis protein LarC [Candidatus Binatia bacterium]|nr:nickel pincer cofactor biosynthesis protein LarC [Candidatus Binatia bacterium]